MAGFPKTRTGPPNGPAGGDLTGTYPNPAVTSTANVRALNGAPLTPWSTVNVPWLNEIGAVSGAMTAAQGAFNQLAFNDSVAAPVANYIAGFQVVENIFTPATGTRFGIYGHVTINSAGVNNRANALFSAVQGRMDINASMGGTLGTPVGSAWGSNFIGAIDAGTFLDQVYGSELDVFVAAGSSVDSKIGCLIAKIGTDAVQGTSVDSGLMIADVATHTVPWKQGITFGRIASTQWPFDNTSTMIGVMTPGNANRGIDWTGVTFTNEAIKVPGAVSLSALTFNAAANESTGAGAAALGANCPAVTPAAPFTWEKVTTSNGSTGYVPVWK